MKYVYSADAKMTESGGTLLGIMASVALLGVSASLLFACPTMCAAYPAPAVPEASAGVPARLSMPVGSASAPGTAQYRGAVPFRTEVYAGRDVAPLYATGFDAAAGAQPGNFRGDPGLPAAYNTRQDSFRGYHDQTYEASAGYPSWSSAANPLASEAGVSVTASGCVQCGEHGAATEGPLEMFRSGSTQDVRSNVPRPQRSADTPVRGPQSVSPEISYDQGGRHTTAPPYISGIDDSARGPPPQRQSWLFSATRDKLASAIGFMKNTQELRRYPLPSRGEGGDAPESSSRAVLASLDDAQTPTSQYTGAEGTHTEKTVEAMKYRPDELSGGGGSSTTTASALSGDGAHPLYNVYVNETGATPFDGSSSVPPLVPFETQPSPTVLSPGFAGPLTPRPASLALGIASNAYQKMIPRAELFLASSRYAEEYLDLFAALYCLFQKWPCNNMEEFAEETRRRQEGSGS
ncbi:hypothetical protein CSUI_011213 [Cystoisospora suis]|uniref:Uncharacterized protein n=1 Tax=Cystoisospora suis TaxID=483139 RepID=A0A2C6KF66_9APIC|nr:hypothetical protein CSUI_011213 [Cystoisospora suis]